MSLHMSPSRPVARSAGGGGPNLEKVDKIYTRGEKFSKKKVILTKILEFCRAGGGPRPPWHPPRYGPAVCRIVWWTPGGAAGGGGVQGKGTVRSAGGRSEFLPITNVYQADVRRRMHYHPHLSPALSSAPLTAPPPAPHRQYTWLFGDRKCTKMTNSYIHMTSRISLVSTDSSRDVACR